jgi:hypothetical protein
MFNGNTISTSVLSAVALTLCLNLPVHPGAQGEKAWQKSQTFA